MAEGRAGQAPEITALDKNMSSITVQIVGDNLQWFSDKLVEKAFTDRKTAQGIVNTMGSNPVSNRVGRLMDYVYGVIKNASNKREKYDSFVDIFSHDAAYCDLAKNLNSSVSTTGSIASCSVVANIPTQQNNAVFSDTTSQMMIQNIGSKNGSLVPLSSTDDVKANIKELTKVFANLKKKIQRCIEEHRILVIEVAEVLTQLSPDADEYHKMFLESHVKNFVRAENHSELFLTMNSHWNYLDPSLLNHIVNELDLDSVKPETESYKSALQQFRKMTPLNLFLQTQRRKWREIPSGFALVVTKFNWPQTVMLEDAEQFRQEYASHYSLHECAMMLIQVLPGSFIVVWLIPVAIVEKLKGNVPKKVLTNHKVKKLTVDGTCVHPDQPDEDEPVNENICLAAHESYFTCDEELSEEETAEHSGQDTPSLSIALTTTSPRTLSINPEPPLEPVTPLAITSPKLENQTLFPDSKDFASEDGIPPSFDDKTSSHHSAVDCTPVTDSGAISLRDNDRKKSLTTEKNQKPTEVVDSSREADSESLPPHAPTTSDIDYLPEVVKLKPSTRVSSEFVQVKIRHFKKRFKGLKKLTQEGLDRKDIAVEGLADYVKSLQADDDDEHKLLTENHIEVIDQAVVHFEIIGSLGFNMNYLSYQLLESIASYFVLKDVTEQMQTYKRDLAEFRLKTPATLFSQTQQNKRSNISPDYKEVVVEFNRPSSKKDELTLETFHHFQRKYASHYRLSDCAMIFGGIRLGSTVITTTWFIPTCIVEKLKHKVPKILLNRCHVSMLRTAGTCVYRSQVGTSDYPYIEEPSDDFFCPVTYALLLQPCLTSCCGKNLSQEAVMRIKKEKGACPLCKALPWEAHDNMEMYRKVKNLRVFCRNEDRGCRWQGELRDFKNHVSNCAMNRAPQLSSLLHPPLPEQKPTKILSLPLPRHRQKSAPVREQKAVKNVSLLDYHNRSVTDHHQRLTDFISCDSRLESHQPLSPDLENLRSRSPSPEKDPLKLGHIRFVSTSRRAEFHEKKKIPCEITRGSAIIAGQFAFFAPLDYPSLYRYEFTTEKWEELPECPYHGSGLAIINGELTTIGGEGSNKLMTLQQGEWVEEYPPMKSERYSPAVVTTSEGNHLIVIGGVVGGWWYATVELLQLKTRKWFIATNLPNNYCFLPSAIISDDQLNVIGSYSNSFSCSIKDLLSNDQPITSPLTLSWTPLPPLPVTRSTAATICGQLVLIGGQQRGSQVNSIHQLVDEQWIKIGSMTRKRSWCLAVNPIPDKILIVGGHGAQDSAEECTVYDV